MKKLAVLILSPILAAMSLQGQVLWQDSTNYPYVNGSIESQGQWYCFNETTPYLDARVTNNVLLLTTNGYDEVAAPTNGWVNANQFTFASFSINVSQLPTTYGGYFCQFRDNTKTNYECNVYVDAVGTNVPGTYRIGVANYSTSFGSAYQPINYQMDLAPGINYTVVILFDNDPENTTFAGSTLWINPSEADWIAAENSEVISPNYGNGYVYASDIPISTVAQNFTITQIAFEPYTFAGISNVIAGVSFESVNTTNLPVIGIQPQPQTSYSGASATFYTVASGADLTYQWYDQFVPLTEGVNTIGSQSNILVLNNLAATEVYYAEITDAYGHTIYTANATNTVITTPTPPFFPASVVATNLTNTLFSTATFNDPALGTGPITYQWYFAPSNTPTAFGQLTGDTNSSLTLTLNDYTAAGNYYVAVTGGDGSTNGPTNNLVEAAPLNGTLAQLYALVLSMTNQIAANKSGTINVNTNNVTVSGYITSYGGLGSSYDNMYMQDASGYGINIYLGGHGNTNTPPVGTYVSVTGPLEIYKSAFEIAPATASAIVAGAAPVIPLTPKLENANFNLFATNTLSATSLVTSGSLITLTNVYIYTSSSGGALPAGKCFTTNGATTLYCTVGGPYSSPSNTNTIEVYQYGYNYPSTYPATSPTGILSPFYNQPIPSHCAQLTGVYVPYSGQYPEIEPSRLADYVVTAPASFSASIAVTNGKPTIQWPAQTGATYSVWSETTVTGPWTQTYGLTYYPTNGSFTDTNTATAKYYKISNP